jgi:20S proteasome subunit beta 4
MFECCVTNTHNRIWQVDDTKLMGVTGPTGDRVNFTEYILRNIHLYALRNGVSLSTHATANYTRFVLSDTYF